MTPLSPLQLTIDFLNKTLYIITNNPTKRLGMPYTITPFNYYGTSENQIQEDLSKANENFAILKNAFYQTPDTALLKQAIFSDVDLGFASYYVGTSLPASPPENTLFYNTSTKTLHLFEKGMWVDIQWQDIIKSTKDWREGWLNITADGTLLFRDNTNTWRPVIPLVGRRRILLETVDNTNFSYLFYIPTGYTVEINNVNHLPFILKAGISYECWTEVDNTIISNSPCVLQPNNVATNFSVSIWWMQSSFNFATGVYNGFRVFYLNQNNSLSQFFITQHHTFHIIGVEVELVLKYNNALNMVNSLLITSSQDPIQSVYWLGVFRRGDNNNPFTMRKAVITRVW